MVDDDKTEPSNLLGRGQLPDVISSLMKIKREKEAEEYNRDVSVARWTKVAAVAAILGAVAAIVAAAFSFIAWRYPLMPGP
jgi:hypothetical protein